MVEEELRVHPAEEAGDEAGAEQAAAPALDVAEGFTARMDRLDLLAKLFRGFGDPIRLAVLQALEDGEKSVEELCELIGVKQPRMSNHLACLRWCQFVQSRREGQRVYYRLADPLVPQIIGLGERLMAKHAERLYSCTRL